MKHIWQPEDISAGLYVIKNTSPKGSKNLSFACTVVYKVGFCHNTPVAKESSKSHYGLISCLTDGWYFPVGTKEDIAKMFNEDQHGYRPLTKSEYIKLIESTNQGFLFA